MKKTNFDTYIEREIRKNPKLKDELARADVAIDISMQIYKLRKSLSMTQKELAVLTGVKQSNIARLERADYEGYSLRTLNKIARALKTKLKISLIPQDEEETKVTINYMIHYFFNPIYEIRIKLLSNESVSFIIPNSRARESQEEIKRAESFSYQ